MNARQASSSAADLDALDACAAVRQEPVARLWSYEQLLELLADKERRLNAAHSLVSSPTFKVGRLIAADELAEAIAP